MVDAVQLGIGSPPGPRMRASFLSALFSSGGASFPWGALRAGACANLQHCNRQTHQERVGKRSRIRGWGWWWGGRQAAVTPSSSVPQSPLQAPHSAQRSRRWRKLCLSLSPSLLLCTSCLRQGWEGACRYGGWWPGSATLETAISFTPGNAWGKGLFKAAEF